jgi:hypothetical protein
MILSSADIVEILNGSGVLRLSLSEVRIVEKRPIASGREGFFVYVEKYPTVDEFEATWKIWIESDGSEPDDLLFEEMRRLLPGFSFKLGLIIEATVKEFKTGRTETRPEVREAPPLMPPTGWMDSIEKRFESLAEDIQDRMLLVSSGKPGANGAPGRTGAQGPAGRDGKDLLATSAILDDLQDVVIAERIPLQKGQVLTYNGNNWENLYVPQATSIASGSGGGTDLTVVSGNQGSTISWAYHEETGEPHDRKFHTDGETDATLVTGFHVSKINSAGNDSELLLDALLPITSQIYISDQNDPSLAHLYNLDSYVETTDGFNLQVTHVETPGPEPTFIANDKYDFLFLTAGGSGGGGATSIDELTDVDTSTATPFVGQTLVWDGTNWVPGDSSEGIGEAPIDNNYYVRHQGRWVNMIEAINMINLLTDGGDFTQGEAFTVDSYIYDGGDLINNTSDTGEQIPPAEGYEDLDGGDFS